MLRVRLVGEETESPDAGAPGRPGYLLSVKPMLAAGRAARGRLSHPTGLAAGRPGEGVAGLSDRAL